MGSVFRAVLVVCLLTAAGSAQAEFVNGDFSSGPTAWTWKQALITDPDCSLALAQFQPRQSVDTPTNQYDPVRGRFANLNGAPSGAVGTW